MCATLIVFWGNGGLVILNYGGVLLAVLAAKATVATIALQTLPRLGIGNVTSDQFAQN
jgi:hypothetical protein